MDAQSGPVTDAVDASQIWNPFLVHSITGESHEANWQLPLSMFTV